MHAGQLLGDGVLRPVLLLRQPLDPPDLRTCDFARPLKEIALAMELEMASYADWIRVERRLSSSLRSLARWGFVDQERRQREEGHKFWYNAYWKTKPAR